MDNTRISTPFDITPAVSPSKPLTIPLPDPPPSLTEDTMSSEQVNPFFGNKKDENPENFLRSFYRRMGSTSTDDAKKQQFPNFLEADSVADEWFADLAEDEKKIGKLLRLHSESVGQGRKQQRKQQRNTRGKYWTSS